MAPSVVGFIDMDCFYVAVEIRRDPSLYGLPCAVVQYNSRTAGGAPTMPAEANRRVPAEGASGGIIAVSYEARQRGVTRQMNCNEARKQCPEIVLVQVPTAFGKADLAIYKNAGDEVVKLLASRATCCEKRSVDEVAFDISAEAERLLHERSWEEDLLPAAITASHLADSVLSRSKSTVSRDETRKGHSGQKELSEAQEQQEGSRSEREAAAAVALSGGWEQASQWGQRERLLVAGAVLVAELRAAVGNQLGFSCSGGVAENKLLAKLGCGLHKPNQQTIVLPAAVAALLHDLPLDRLQGLGGDLGAQVKEALKVTTCSELAAIPVARLEFTFPGKGAYLHEMATGTHNEPVQDRELVKSLASSKTFPGRLCLKTAQECEHWLHELAGELHRRYHDQVTRNARAPTRISVHIGSGAWGSPGHSDSSRQMPLELGRSATVEQIAKGAVACFHRWLVPGAGPLSVTGLGMSLSGFQPLGTGLASLARFFGSSAAAAVPPAATKAAAGSGAGTVARPPLLRLLAGAAAGAPLPLAKDTATPSPFDGQPPGPAAAAAAADVTSTVQQAIDVDAEPEPLSAAASGSSIGTTGLVSELGVDLDVFAVLPRDVQAEVLQQMAPAVREAVMRKLQPRTVVRTVEQSGGQSPPKRSRTTASGVAAVRATSAVSGCRGAGASGIAAFFRPAAAKGV